jgi:hypothetical protein
MLMLWVRALDNLDPRPLVGTEGAMFPFWSPDSRSIGFFTRSKLKKIDIAGGPAEDIADVVLGRVGAWNSEGVILYCPRPVGPLYQVTVKGRTPKAASSLDAARAEVVHSFPQFLPDNRHFLYLAASSRRGESSIRVGSLDSAVGKVLVSADTSAAYAPVLRGHAGSLLFVHDGALIARPLDLERLEMGRERTVVVAEIRSKRWYQGGFSVSNNGVLVYQAGGVAERQFAWLDRRGKVVTKVGPRIDHMSLFTSFGLSPHERYVAIQRHDDPDTVLPTIWVIDLLRDGSVCRFTETDIAEPEFNPVWSPDGGELLFSRGDDRRMRLFRQALNGGPPNAFSIRQVRSS